MNKMCNGVYLDAGKTLTRVYRYYFEQVMAYGPLIF